MWRRTALMIVIGLTLALQGKGNAQGYDECDLLISDLNWVRFDVVMGRVVATSNRTKQDRQRARRELPDGSSECLTVTLDRGLISLHYSLQCNTRQLTIRVVRRDEMEIRWTRRQLEAGPVTSIYTQNKSGVSLAVCAPEWKEQVYRASSLWHLTIAHRDVCESHLVGALQPLRPDWQPMDEAHAIRAHLFHTSPWPATTSPGEITLLVAQLADADFRVRQHADRELRSRGRCVLAWLDELNAEELDAEQKLRIAAIRRAIECRDTDTPERVAAWLINDKRVWLALLTDEHAQRRQVARQQLARICAHPINFDPLAPPAERDMQIAALHTRLLQR